MFLWVHPTRLIDSIIDDVGLNDTKVKLVPAKMALPLHAFKGKPPFDLDFNYRSAAGKLNYLAQTTWPNIMYAMHQTAKYSSDPRWGWLYGMRMDSYKSQFSDGCPVVSGKKTKSQEPVSQYVQTRVSILLVLNVHIPAYLGSRGSPFFGLVSLLVLSADRRLVRICIYTFVSYKLVHVKSYKNWIYTYKWMCLILYVQNCTFKIA